MKTNSIMAAAIQLDTRVGNTEYNLQACQRLAQQALGQGASWIALPEFFNTGISFEPQLINAIETESGPAANFLRRFSYAHNIVIGGSFLCRLEDGSVRNRYLCFSNGQLVGKHDKDLPTMWENAFYQGAEANDTGELGKIDNMRVGSAVCWEFLRSQTSRRLQGKVDIVMGGSHWWSIPMNWPRFLTRKMELRNSNNFISAVRESARLIGAPVIHASHCNILSSRFPSIPRLTYQGILEGHTAIIDGHGKVLAHRGKEEGEGIICAKVPLGYVGTEHKIPKRFWLRARGFLPALSWYLDGYFGKRWYRKHVLTINNQH